VRLGDAKVRLLTNNLRLHHFRLLRVGVSAQLFGGGGRKTADRRRIKGGACSAKSGRRRLMTNARLGLTEADAKHTPAAGPHWLRE
jgi:hypothetical protein